MAALYALHIRITTRKNHRRPTRKRWSCAWLYLLSHAHSRLTGARGGIRRIQPRKDSCGFIRKRLRGILLATLTRALKGARGGIRRITTRKNHRRPTRKRWSACGLSSGCVAHFFQKKYRLFLQPAKSCLIRKRGFLLKRGEQTLSLMIEDINYINTLSPKCQS